MEAQRGKEGSGKGAHSLVWGPGNFLKLYMQICAFWCFFGNICLGQQCPAKILDWQKDTPARAVFLMGGGRWAYGGMAPSRVTPLTVTYRLNIAKVQFISLTHGLNKFLERDRVATWCEGGGAAI